MALRRQSGKSGKSGSPLDDRQRKLLAEQEKVRQKMEQLSRVIEEAPRIKEELARARRDELLTDRSTRAHHRLNSTTLVDHRYSEFAGGTPSRARRPLKAERRQTRLMFFGLLLLLFVLVVWLLSVWHWQWPG